MTDMTPAPHGGPGSRRSGGETASWMIGVILICLGVAFLLERAGMIAFVGNWWSIFIYLAAIVSLGNAWRSYRAREGFGPAAGGSLTWGLVLAVVASIFWFELTWDRWWPAILIAVGVGMVVSSWLGNVTGRSGGDGR
jgi:hypothetical protein